MMRLLSEISVFLILASNISVLSSTQTNHTCLTGTFSDIQTWVDETGNFLKDGAMVGVLDVSNSKRVMDSLKAQLYRTKSTIRYVNMSKCKLRHVPNVFDMQGGDAPLASTVRYMSFYGNNFQVFESSAHLYTAQINATSASEQSFGADYAKWIRSSWASGFKGYTFPELLELDLRSCSIQTISFQAFEGMPSLENLYLSDNNIFFINARAFVGLNKLQHLDLSRNDVTIDGADGLQWEDSNVLRYMPKLKSLDLSHTKISKSKIDVFKGLNKEFSRLSLCYTGIRNLGDGIFSNTSMKILDVSGNYGIFNKNALKGIEDTLEVMAADDTGLCEFEIFKDFKNLQFLSLVGNEITEIPATVSKTLRKLDILILNHNRIHTWTNYTFSYMTNLKLLALEYNVINIIRGEMIEDLANIRYVGISGSFYVCNCNAKELYLIALSNAIQTVENDTSIEYIEPETVDVQNRVTNFHTGNLYRYMVKNNKSLSNVDDKFHDCNHDIVDEGNIMTLYDLKEDNYQCLFLDSGVTIPFSNIQGCAKRSDVNYDEVLMRNWNKLFMIIIIPSCMLLVVCSVYYFRRNFMYFCITVKNSAMLSLITDKNAVTEDTIFNYDVFVSYCNEDRAWVLQQLLPQLETECRVSVCLHERDFTVGLPILENIVSCMDRSRSIMLIISQRFLLSQWCQFEMHLAQHRLLETRREDLILVLLEDIPRRMRPNTLQYLMLTKTYVLWPKQQRDHNLFWRRLKKCILLQKLRRVENVSLA